MKIAFMGTPDFAVPCLEYLIKSEHEVVGVFCQPDKPKGRTQELVMPDTKKKALEYNIPVFQPVSLKNGVGTEILKELSPDLVIVVAYGKILPKDFLDFPKYGCINVHGSILPKYRGAAPIQWSILNGDEEAGVTSMQMDAGLDTGDMLLVKKIKIGENETAQELFDRLSFLGAEVLDETIKALEKGELHPVKQDEAQATYVGLLSKENSPTDFSLSAREVHNHIRGLYSWPGATTKLSGKILKIHKSVLSAINGNNKPGSVVSAQDTIVVCCGDNKCVELCEVQLEGKKRMSSADFLRGRKIEKGTILGE